MWRGRPVFGEVALSEKSPDHEPWRGEGATAAEAGGVFMWGARYRRISTSRNAVDVRDFPKPGSDMARALASLGGV